jgi:hypothetical protein
MSLQTGTTLILLLNTINKVSGLYGLLALLTGLPLSSSQLSMYIYSLMILGLFVFLSPHIPLGSPLQNLLLAWLYLLDSVVNVVYTALFAMGWFTLLAAHDASQDIGGIGPGGKTLNETAGFTSPEHANVSSTTVDLSSGGLTGHGPDTLEASSPVPALLQSGSLASVAVIATLWGIRFYFVAVVFAYARGCVRQAVAVQAQNGVGQLAGGSTEEGGKAMAENPFAEGRELGFGWKGRLGRALTGVMKPYWLGADEGGEWVRMELGRSNGANGAGAGKGVIERERRRRAGTGPPKPDLALDVPKR